jgi:ribosomal-protein-alanine N-acetyltransferase
MSVAKTSTAPSEDDVETPPAPRAPEVTIAPMRRRHLRAVMRIEAQAVHKGWSVGLYLAELRREVGRRYLVAKVDGTVVGYGGLLFQDDDAHITILGVDEAWQNRRIATRLMLVLAREAAQRGAKNLTLEVRASNEPAVKLYRRFGLAPAGIRKNYYADIGEDALIMWAHEIDAPEYAQRLAEVERGLDGPTRLEDLEDATKKRSGA